MGCACGRIETHKLLHVGSELSPEPSGQLDIEKPAQLSPDVSARDSQPEPELVTKTSLPTEVRLQACIGGLPSKAIGQACLAVIRQASGTHLGTDVHPVISVSAIQTHPFA